MQKEEIVQYIRSNDMNIITGLDYLLRKEPSIDFIRSERSQHEAFWEFWYKFYKWRISFYPTKRDLDTEFQVAVIDLEKHPFGLGAWDFNTELTTIDNLFTTMNKINEELDWYKLNGAQESIEAEYYKHKTKGENPDYAQFGFFEQNLITSFKTFNSSF